jgi:hypothetical protein
MTGEKDDQSPEQIAKANRLRLAKEEGVRAMEDAQREAISVRKNMARLRELRLAKEAAPARDRTGCKGETEKAIKMKQAASFGGFKVYAALHRHPELN